MCTWIEHETGHEAISSAPAESSHTGRGAPNHCARRAELREVQLNYGYAMVGRQPCLFCRHYMSPLSTGRSRPINQESNGKKQVRLQEDGHQILLNKRYTSLFGAIAPEPAEIHTSSPRLAVKAQGGSITRFRYSWTVSRRAIPQPVCRISKYHCTRPSCCSVSKIMNYTAQASGTNIASAIDPHPKATPTPITTITAAYQNSMLLWPGCSTWRFYGL